jgi:hypothetical protein
LNVLVKVDSTSPDDVRSLRAWLEEIPAVRHHARMHVAADRDHDATTTSSSTVTATTSARMGVDPDVLSLAVTGGLTLLNLAVAIVQWRTTRPRSPVVSITLINNPGKVLRIDTSDQAALERAVRELREE